MTRMTFAVLALVLFAALPARAEEIVAIESRPGVTQQFILIEADAPFANVILFVGGSGKLRRKGGRIRPVQANFLARTRGLFAAESLNVAVVDAPSDMRREKYGLRTNRRQFRHADDIGAVIDHLRRRAALPVWVIGTSRGTVSAAFIAGGPILPKVDGLVLTASVTRPSGKPGQYLLDDEGISLLESVRVPSLLVHHKDDRCFVTPAGDVKLLEKHLKAKASKVDVILFEGGKSPKSDPCKPFSQHGFYGIEETVVKAIADWIKANTR